MVSFLFFSDISHRADIHIPSALPSPFHHLTNITMAHRGPLREMFRVICLTLLVAESERAPTPASTTGFIEDVVKTFTANETTHAIPTTPHVTPPVGGLQSIFLVILASLIALLGDEAISRIAHMVLFNCIFPMVRITSRHIIAYGTRMYRRVRGPGVQNDDTDQSLEEIDESSRSSPDDGTDEWFDAEESQPSSAEIPDNTPEPDVDDDQTPADLRETIAKLTRTIETKSSTIKTLDGRHSTFLAKLRRSLDPRSLYPKNTNVVIIASDLVKDRKRFTRRMKRKNKELQESQGREERGKLADKDREIANLTVKNRELDVRIKGLEEGQLSSVFHVQEHERRADEKLKSLRARMLEAESEARRGFTTRDYNTLRSQFDVVADHLRQARQEAQDALSAQEGLTGELRDERAQSQRLQTIIDSEAEAQRQTASRTSTETQDLERANGRIASLEQEALNHGEEVRSAETRAEGAERRAQAAEDKATDDATLQENLQKANNEAKDEVRKSHDSIKKLKQELRTARRAQKDKAKPEVVATRPDENLVAENTNLRVKLDEATKRESEAFNDGFLQALAQNPPSDQADVPSHPEQQDASCQTNAPEDDPLYQQGRQEERRACEEQAQTLIETAVRQARQEGEEALKAAVGRNEQALKASAETAWTSNEARLRAEFDAVVQNSASEESSLRGQLQAAVQRAIKAESTLANTADALQTEQNSFTDMQTNAAKEWKRAEDALAEVEKYKKGKLSQDGRINGHRDEIARLKRLIPQDAELAVAELNATMGDRARSIALIDESLHRHYDHPTREVLQQLLDANASILALKGLLKTPPARPTQKELLGVLKGAEVDIALFASLNFQSRQVVVKQCRAVNARLAELRMIVLGSREPDRATLLRAVYQNRGDEEAEWYDDDPKTEPSSDEDDDDDDPVLTSRVQRPVARQTRQPVSRRNRPQPPPQPQPHPEPQPAPVAASTPATEGAAPKDTASGTIPQVQIPTHSRKN